MKGVRTVVMILAAMTVLTGCSNIRKDDSVSENVLQHTDSVLQESMDETATDSAAEIGKEPEAITGEAFVIDLAEGKPESFECADGWSNGSMFNVTWRKGNVSFGNEGMKLIIDKDENPAGDIPYSGGEFRSKDFYHYGRYEVSMKAIKNDGVVSSFFTYTGPSDNQPWDEIDVEILGKDTTKVQLNYFTNGKGNHEYLHELGFDASEDFHTYAFEWHPDKIVWFVDGEEIHSATESIPVTPGKIMMNAWCGIGVDEWLGVFDDTRLPVAAEYQWIRFTPFE